MGIFVEMANGNKQAVIGNIGNTDIINIEKPNGEELFVLTNNKVFGRFNFVQEFADEDTAWDRAETISYFERDFAEAHYCSVTEDGEIALWFTDKEPHFYFITLKELCKMSITGLRTSKPSISFNLPVDARVCVDYINLKLNKLKIKAVELLGSPLTRVELTEGNINRSYNIVTTFYNSIKATLKRCANIGTAHNLIIANGGVRHIEAPLNRL